MDRTDYSQQNIRDRILNRKKTLLLSDSILFPDANRVKLDKGKAEYIRKIRKNPDKQEDNIDENRKPTNTALVNATHNATERRSV